MAHYGITERVAINMRHWHGILSPGAHCGLVAVASAVAGLYVICTDTSHWAYHQGLELGKRTGVFCRRGKGQFHSRSGPAGFTCAARVPKRRVKTSRKAKAVFLKRFAIHHQRSSTARIARNVKSAGPPLQKVKRSFY
uniref:Uncharacterized protein n=1 Tax=Anopheles farauti TaxID=69004 RepID=A0A182QVW5_9DIPT